MNKYYRLAEMTEKLVAVAQGREKADVVIKNGRLINVNTGEIMDNMDISITHGRIALVGDATHTIGSNTQIIDAKGLYMAPGFMDGHIHVESSMMPVREYAKTVMPHGTTAIYMDPHEIGNVLGMDGIRLMMDDAKEVPLKVYTVTPSCVPAVPGFEDAGASIGPDDIKNSMEWEGVAGLGEMMNFPGVISGDHDVHSELKATLEADKIITGHYSMPETGSGLNAYIASGVRCCHESIRAEDALAKMRLGMYAQLREGSAWHDVKETVKSITENNIDTRYATLVSDDTHPSTLISKGHMDYIVKRAIEEGVNPITAIQMATINVAQCFQMDRDLGSISPGKCADIVFISDLTQVKVEMVLINGEIVAKGGKTIVEIPKGVYPKYSKDTMKVGRKLTPKDFVINVENRPNGRVKARVMEIVEAKVNNYARECMMPVLDEVLGIDLKQDIIKAAVIERHKATGTMGKGLVKGFHIKEGAIASTVAHDAHNLLVIGVNDDDMALAANTLIKTGGGMVAVRNGEVTGLLPLPIAGLMSELPAEDIAKNVDALGEAWRQLGCDLVSPFMTMALLSLAVLPELRLTNRGLVDTVNFKFTDLIIE